MRWMFTLLLALAAVPADAGNIYKYVDANGVVTYTNIRPTHRNYAVVNLKCRNCGWQRQVNWANVPLNLDAFTPEILAAARSNGLSEAVLRAIIHAESSFRPRAESDMGAQGLMQLMPATARRYGVASPFDPAENIRGGAAYLVFLMDRYDGQLKLAAAAYNAGEGAVDRFGGIPPYEETRNFVARVEILERRYQRALARNTGGGTGQRAAPR
ncbi:MAG: transglycosylase SLT domain-containing protein [Pseudomonadota bacterium]